MSNKYSRTIDDLFSMFSDTLSPEDIMTAKLISQISSAITKGRLNLNMNQTDFAEHIGASQSLVSRWEHGDYNFSLKKLSEIAVKLDLDVNISISRSGAVTMPSRESKAKVFTFMPKQEPAANIFYEELEEM